MQSDDDIRNWFHFHPATAVTGPKHDRVRSTFRATADHLLRELPAGPDRTLALRKLQEAMWAANSAIACNQTEDAPQLNPHSVDTGPIGPPLF